MIASERGAQRRYWALGIILAACGSLAGAASEPGFNGAKWIWFAPKAGADPMNYPACASYFRVGFARSEKAPVKKAELIVTADNLWTVYLNGKLVGESESDNGAWSRPKRFDVASLVAPGRNVLAAEAVNTLPGPAGFLARLEVELTDGQRVTVSSDTSWKCSDEETANWQQPDFNEQTWGGSFALADYGAAPWGRPAAPATAAAPGGRGGLEEAPPPDGYPWPEAVIYVGGDCSLYRPVGGANTSYDSLSVTIFNPRHSRAFPEHDLPAPMKVGRKLFVLKPARAGTVPRVLLDAGAGAIGSPSVSFDGRWIYLSMVPAGESFFQIFRLPAEGGEPQRVTKGPFHDIDPAELPDGRIVFTSTRIGTFEEYHNPPSRALFVMKPDGGDIQPITSTFIFDNEPEVMADGRLIFVRSDNFFDRGKVETMLHAIHPDGTEGYTEFGLDLGPEYGGRLRAFYCGSPAPMPDGRVAYVTGSSVAVGRPGAPAQYLRHLPLEAGDVAALPDGRLICTVGGRFRPSKQLAKTNRPGPDCVFEKLVIVDPDRTEVRPVLLHQTPGEVMHSPVYLGPRQRPPMVVDRVEPRAAAELHPMGFLLCQNARFTKNTTAGWKHVRAIRVLAGTGLTTRSSHSYIVHAGSEVTELGTVPLAPDGSFFIEVPADRAIAFQAVDADGRSELNEMSWIYVRPGEFRACVGCHQPRQSAPLPGPAEMQAMRSRPLQLTGQGKPLRFRGNNAAVTGMMEMQFDRYREIAGINRHSDSARPLETGAGEVAALVAQLRSGNSDLKITAAQRLAVFRDRAAAGALAECLGDNYREVRIAAAMALGSCSTRNSAEPLLSALTDPEPLAGQAALIAFEELTGCPVAFNAFAEAPERARQAKAVREWFASTGWDKIEATLAATLASSDRDAARRAASTLSHMGGELSRTALRAYVERERSINPYPKWRETHQGDGAQFNSLSAANPRALQAAVRALGFLKDETAVPFLAETAGRHLVPETANLFLAEAAVEALGRIGSAESVAALTNLFARLQDYPHYTRWYGDHDALMACHASPVHYLIAEALDSLGSAQARSIVPHLLRSVPTDPDRALLLGSDDCETLVGRVIRRSGRGKEVTETCLSILGDKQAVSAPEIEKAIAATHQAWGGKPDAQNRAAQILSLVCRDPADEPRLRAAFDRFRAKSNDIPRVFDTGIPVVNVLPARHWVCFYLARALGNVGSPDSVSSLLAALEQSPPEAASGRPDPLGPGVLFLHNDLTPCWRAATAWALGRIGDKRAFPALLKLVNDLENAPDTRHAAAEALGQLADAGTAPTLEAIANGYPEVSTRKALRMAAERAARPAGSPSTH